MLIAAGGAVAYAVKFHPADHHPTPVPTRLVNNQVVGIVARSATAGTPGHSGITLVQMLGAGRVPDFAPLTIAASNGQGPGQWTAALMTGSGYIFIFQPDGNCLAAKGRARLVMQHCNDSAAAQRWRRVSGAVALDGHSFYQYANLATGRCLSVAAAPAGAPERAILAPCQHGQPASQLIAFWWTTQ